MLTTAAVSPQSPNSTSIYGSRSGRKPLQPSKNHHENLRNLDINITPKPQKPRGGGGGGLQSSILEDDFDGHAESNKENHPPPPPPPPPPFSNQRKKMEKNTTTTIPAATMGDASLAEELSALREKLERMRIDKQNTEKLLLERDLMLQMHMDTLLNRGQLQRMLEIEVDRLYRLNQLRSSSSSLISPIRSLRDKEQEKKTTKEDQQQQQQHTSGISKSLLQEEEGGEEEDRDGVQSGCATPNPQTPQLDSKDESSSSPTPPS